MVLEHNDLFCPKCNGKNIDLGYRWLTNEEGQDMSDWVKGKQPVLAYELRTAVCKDCGFHIDNQRSIDDARNLNKKVTG